MNRKMTPFNELFIEFTDWQNDTFPLSTESSRIEHLKEEVEELLNEVKNNENEHAIEMEYADCFLLLFGAASKRGYSFVLVYE